MATVKYIQPNVTGRAAYSIAEAMMQSGLGRDTIYKAINSGQLSARKVGRRTIVLAGDLQQYLESLPRLGDGKAA
jgi:excisionase family DNA binding protein